MKEQMEHFREGIETFWAGFEEMLEQRFQPAFDRTAASLEQIQQWWEAKRQQ
jgi:hypothetical protein